MIQTFFTDACEKKKKKACGTCSMKEIKLSLASAGLLRWNFFVAISDHALVWAGLSSGKLRTSTCNACFRTLSMCIFKIGQERKERKHLNLRISAKIFQRRQKKNPCGKASDHIWHTQHCKGSISRKEVMRLMSLMESRLITNFLFGLITIMVSFHVYTPVCVCCVHAIIPQV